MNFARRKNEALLFPLLFVIILMGIGYASINSVSNEISSSTI